MTVSRGMGNPGRLIMGNRMSQLHCPAHRINRLTSSRLGILTSMSTPQTPSPFLSTPHPLVTRYPLLRNRTQIVVPLGIIPPPTRERHGRPAGAKHGKRQDKQRRQTGPVKRTRDKVRVVAEDARLLVAQIHLHVETRQHLAQDHTRLRRVVGDVARIL